MGTVTLEGGGVSIHANLTGLPADDHLQYLLLAGRAGGQYARGGTLAGQSLILRGSASSPDTGIIESESPITISYDTFTNTTPAEQFAIRWGPTATISGTYIGGALSVSPQFTVTTGVFIPATFSDTSNMMIGATPGFSAFTFINELAVIRNSGNFNLPSALVMNIGLTHERNTSGTSTSPGTTGISFSPQTRATVSGAIMTKTNQIGLRFSPTFSTVAGSTANLGLLIGVQMNNPAVALFQPGAGAESSTGIFGLVMNSMAFGGNITKEAVRCGLAAASNSYFLRNVGTARSNFGSSNIEFNDLNGCVFGTSQDCVLAYAGGTNSLFMQFTTSNADQLHFSNPGNARVLVQGGLTTAAVDELNFNFARFSLGAQAGSNGNQVGNFVAGTRTVSIGGDWSDFLLTQAGNITVDAAMGTLAGWTINAPSITIGTGSVTTGCALNLGGNPNQGTNRIGMRIISNPTGGGGINAALWITAGRSRFDGFVDINKPIALGGGAAATLGTIGGSGPTAAAQAQWVQIEVNGVNHWIPAWT